jgi:hypothetical protein
MILPKRQSLRPAALAPDQSQGAAYAALAQRDGFFLKNPSPFLFFKEI